MYLEEGGKERTENKTTFKEGVKFPKLECTVEIRTEHSEIVLEPPGWLSLLWYVFSKLVVSLMARVGNFVVRKTCEKSSFFYSFVLSSRKKKKRKTLKHRCRFDLCQMYNSPDTSSISSKPLERALCSFFYWSSEKDETCTAEHDKFLPWYPGASVRSLLVPHGSHEGFGTRVPFPFASLLLHNWPSLVSWDRERFRFRFRKNPIYPRGAIREMTGREMWMLAWI